MSRTPAPDEPPHTSPRCTEPGCGATIIDGDSDICGLAPHISVAAVARAAGDPAAAVPDRVDPTSAWHTDAVITGVEVLLTGRNPADITEELPRDGGGRIERLVIESKYRAAQARRGVLSAAMERLSAGHHATKPDPPRGRGPNLAGARPGPRNRCPDLARGTEDLWGRIELVDHANRTRPRTVP